MRHARIESATGIYHVILRGINRQNIFENRNDFKWFEKCLKKVKESCGLKVFAYCLMSNHAHIVAGVGSEPIGASLKRIGVSYAFWYNNKYNRQGTLFQDRYISEPVEDDNYLLAVVRYIHQNPIMAGICKTAADYEWSSYADYIGESDGFTDTEDVLGLFSENLTNQIRLFEEFTQEAVKGEYVDIDDDVCSSDDAIKDRIEGICGARSAGEFQSLPPDEREQAIRMMRVSGLSIRQVVRFTGVPFGIVRMIGKR